MPTTAVHDECFHSVFAALAERCLTLNGEKGVFGAPAIEYAGLHLSAEGMRPLHSNTEAIARAHLTCPGCLLLRHDGVLSPVFPQSSDTMALLCKLLRTGSGHQPALTRPEVTAYLTTDPGALRPSQPNSRHM